MFLHSRPREVTLPQAKCLSNLYTEYYGTCNLSNLLKFVELRLHEGAQWEIQSVAKACLEFSKELFPVTVEAYLALNK